MDRSSSQPIRCSSPARATGSTTRSPVTALFEAPGQDRVRVQRLPLPEALVGAEPGDREIVGSRSLGDRSVDRSSGFFKRIVPSRFATFDRKQEIFEKGPEDVTARALVETEELQVLVLGTAGLVLIAKRRGVIAETRPVSRKTRIDRDVPLAQDTEPDPEQSGRVGAWTYPKSGEA